MGGGSQDTVPLQWSGAPLAKKKNGKKESPNHTQCVVFSLLTSAELAHPREHHLRLCHAGHQYQHACVQQGPAHIDDKDGG